jgi:hypothetical protein
MKKGHRANHVTRCCSMPFLERQVPSPLLIYGPETIEMVNTLEYDAINVTAGM